MTETQLEHAKAVAERKALILTLGAELNVTQTRIEEILKQLRELHSAYEVDQLKGAQE